LRLLGAVAFLAALQSFFAPTSAEAETMEKCRQAPIENVVPICSAVLKAQPSQGGPIAYLAIKHLYDTARTNRMHEEGDVRRPLWKSVARLAIDGFDQQIKFYPLDYYANIDRFLRLGTILNTLNFTEAEVPHYVKLRQATVQGLSTFGKTPRERALAQQRIDAINRDAAKMPLGVAASPPPTRVDAAAPAKPMSLSDLVAGHRDRISKVTPERSDQQATPAQQPPRAALSPPPPAAAPKDVKAMKAAERLAELQRRWTDEARQGKPLKKLATARRVDQSTIIGGAELKKLSHVVKNDDVCVRECEQLETCRAVEVSMETRAYSLGTCILYSGDISITPFSDYYFRPVVRTVLVVRE
jgi:hypothetical protein